MARKKKELKEVKEPKNDTSTKEDEKNDLDLLDINAQARAKTELVNWVMDKVNSWERWRDENFQAKWAEYYRQWRGIYTVEDKTRDSERSKVTPPALSQAIEAAVSEQEEAIFSNANWFDMADDYMDQEKGDVAVLRNLLLEDMDWNDVPASISEILLLGALYGTGIGKIIASTDKRKKIINIPTEQGRVDAIQEKEYVECKLEPVLPDNFVIDPTVTASGTEGIQSALGCAHIVTKPKYMVMDKMREGVYFPIEVGEWMQKDMDTLLRGETVYDRSEDKVRLVEYYGLVPKDMLKAAKQDDGPVEEGEQGEDMYEDEFVEAVITIANGESLLRVEENAFLMKDRPFVAYAFEKVPGSFFGRGVAEMGADAQRALTAILRAQLDGLALSVHPMMAADATKVPRGTQFKVTPGRTILVNGDPAQALKEFRFPGIDMASYNASADMERYIQMGTGSMDSASPLRTNRRNETVGGMSMIMGGVMKRSKRILSNIERNFLIPLIEKTLWRYMQFSPGRYKPQDFKFKVVGGLGMMAREVETQQLVQLLGFVPPQSPAFFAILAGVIENTSIKSKQEVLQAIQKGMQPDPQEQQARQMQMTMAAQKQQAQTAEIGSRIKYREAQTAKVAAGIETDSVKLLQNALRGGRGSQ